MVGGRDFASYKFNTAVQAVRQPGSLFKPFLYLCALEGGYPPTYRIPNRDVVVVEENGRRWTPRNWDGSRGGEVTLRYGLEHSLNLISVRLMMEGVPPARLVSRVRDLKITTPLAEDYTLALGSSGVIPLEIIAAYGIFANQGIYHKPRAIREIRDRNENLIFAFESPGEEVLSASSAFLITSLLQGVVNRGTASALRWRYHLKMPLAGKTGTTNQFTDAWFVGYTPQLVTGLWIGMDNPAFKLGRGQYGGKVALPVFAGFIKRAYELPEFTPQEFAVPANIEKKEVCDDSGELATPLCPHTHEEYFLQGTAPLQPCSLHRPRGY
jgi:penicillin-binding protein 1A